jgi:hypothetical protein
MTAPFGAAFLFAMTAPFGAAFLFAMTACFGERKALRQPHIQLTPIIFGDLPPVRLPEA